LLGTTAPSGGGFFNFSPCNSLSPWQLVRASYITKVTSQETAITPCGNILVTVPRLVSLAAYSVKVWNPNDRDHEYLSDFDGEGADVLTFVRDVLSKIKTQTLDQKELQQAFSVLKLESKNRSVYGTVETGQYGHESNLINVKTTRVVYKRKKDDAEMLPFYFYFEIPEGVEDGILILQRTSNFGIRKVLHWVLKTAFEEEHPEYKLRFRPLVAETEVDRYIKGKIQKIHFIRKSIPADLADAYDRGHQAVRGTVELVMRASKRSSLPMNGLLSRIFRKDGNVGGVFELEDEDFAYDNVKAEVKVGRSTRTINAAHPGQIRSYFDVTDAVEIASSGHPRYNSIQEQADKLATQLRALLYGAA
jgi:hypothetical protein